MDVSFWFRRSKMLLCFRDPTVECINSLWKEEEKSMPKHTLKVFNTLSMVEVTLMYMLGHLFANGNAPLKKLSFYLNLPLSLELCLWILCLYVCKIDNVNMNLKQTI